MYIHIVYRIVLSKWTDLAKCIQDNSEVIFVPRP